MFRHISRRGLLAASGAVLGARAIPAWASESAAKPTGSFRYCLNTSTIMGQKLPLVEQVEVVAKAGYHAIEPWIRDIEAYAKEGKSLSDLKKRIADLGLTVENAIGFAAWIVDDEEQRRKGLEQHKRDMDLASKIGCKRVAAPPIGATEQANLNLLAAAERYRTLAEIGQQFGIVPQIEIWGHSKCLSKLGEAALVATESGFPQGCILPDVYHMYKGNSQFSGLRLMSATAIQTIHLNDYPADPPRATVSDAHRVYPGDGIAPLKSILRDLAAINPQCVLSLEVFNRDYWKLDPLVAVKIGLEKMRAAVASIA